MNKHTYQRIRRIILLGVIIFACSLFFGGFVLFKTVSSSRHVKSEGKKEVEPNHKDLNRELKSNNEELNQQNKVHFSPRPEMKDYKITKLSNEEIYKFFKKVNGKFISKYSSDAQKIFDVYNDFFKDLLLTRGWRTVPFTKEDMEPVFRIASHIVMLIRKFLDEQQEGLKLRMQGGRFDEYLWSIKKKPNFQEEKVIRQLVENLVHFTMKDAKGYVENLTKSNVDLFVEHFYHLLYKIFVKNAFL